MLDRLEPDLGVYPDRVLRVQEFVRVFVRACGVDGLDLDLWLTAWRSVNHNSRAPVTEPTETRMAEPATAPPPAPITEPTAAAPGDTASRLRLAAMSVAGSAAAAIRLCRSTTAQRWLLLVGLGAAGAALLLRVAELQQHLTPSRCTKPDCPSSSPD
ncbi:hypothetical protein AB0F52_48495 [Amycolatopsis sp. NPDC024027]|uniref:hypothetical protein n=1 Tax=Amycolatopsis sp. NPDC024027 TaxID=3154327 RepID=UPI0033CB3601